MNKGSGIVGTIFSCVGVGLLALTFYLYTQQVNFMKQAIPAQGTVSDLSLGGEDNDVYFPSITFKSKEGELIHFTSNVGSNPPSHRVGETVEILYDPSDPNKAQINDTFELWLAPIITGFIGAIFTLIGLGSVIAAIKAKAIDMTQNKKVDNFWQQASSDQPGSLPNPSQTGPIPPIPPSDNSHQGPILK